jgi:hypothetical protein
MAKFPYSMRGYLYEKSLEDMRSAFRATMRALHTEHENNIDKLRAIQRRVEAGEPTAEYDEDGHFLYYHEDAQGMRADQSLFALRSARNAFVVMLHHLWEKAVDDWREAKPKDNYNAQKAYSWLESSGFAIDRDALEFLRTASNAIKHNNRDFWDRYKHQGLFAISDNAVDGVDFATAMRLEDRHVEQIIDALKGCGLRMDSTTGL